MNEFHLQEVKNHEGKIFLSNFCSAEEAGLVWWRSKLPFFHHRKSIICAFVLTMWLKYKYTLVQHLLLPWQLTKVDFSLLPRVKVRLHHIHKVFGCSVSISWHVDDGESFAHSEEVHLLRVTLSEKKKPQNRMRQIIQGYSQIWRHLFLLNNHCYSHNVCEAFNLLMFKLYSCVWSVSFLLALHPKRISTLQRKLGK